MSIRLISACIALIIFYNLLYLIVSSLSLSRLDFFIKYLRASSKNCIGFLSLILSTILGTYLLLDRAVGRIVFSSLSRFILRIISLGVSSTYFIVSSSILSVVISFLYFIVAYSISSIEV